MKLRDYLTAFLILLSIGGSIFLYRMDKDIQQSKSDIEQVKQDITLTGDSIKILSREAVNVGTGPNAGNGDPLRTAFTKLNANDAAAIDSIAAHRSALQKPYISIQVLVPDTLASTTIQTGYDLFSIDENLNGCNLVRVTVLVGESQGTAVPTVTVWRNRGGTEANMITTGGNFTTAAVINTSNDDCAYGDRLSVRMALGSGTPPAGVKVVLTFKKP